MILLVDEYDLNLNYLFYFKRTVRIFSLFNFYNCSIIFIFIIILIKF